MISRYLINTYSFGGGFREFAADYNLDGVVDLYDAVDISKMLIQNSIENELAERQKKEEYVNRVFELVNKERISRGLLKYLQICLIPDLTEKNALPF